ncbi:MAG: hypothetical protein CME07_00220, partial [Gemmatimonadetes bacterium]|nr:hypothetical protein [Gemmatimonadota bacterium]
EGVGAQIHDARETGSPGSPEDLRILLSVGEEVTHAVTLSAETPRADPDPADDNPRMAIVFDDLGYTTTGLPAELLDLGIPLTFAILPGLPHSDEFAEMARERGHEVLLHLPMEPVDAVRHNPGEEAILAGLGAEENLRRLRVQLGSFSGYRGVSNHMGSRATADPELMDVLFGEIRRKDRGLFFLDSRTTPYSVAVASGRRTGLSVINNNLFLDGTDEGEPGPRVLTGRLAAIAQRTGRAVGIGHVRRETVNAVREAIPKWREERVELVLLSELGQDPSRGRKRQSPPRTR